MRSLDGAHDGRAMLRLLARCGRCRIRRRDRRLLVTMRLLRLGWLATKEGIGVVVIIITVARL